MTKNKCNLKNKILKAEDSIDIFIEVLKMDQSEKVVGMITLDYYNKVNGVIELSRGENAFKRIGTDDIFNKAFMLDAFSIIFAYNSPNNLNDLDNKYYEFNNFLLCEAERLQLEVKDHLVILNRDNWISIK